VCWPLRRQNAEDASAILNIIEGIKRDGPLESYSILTQLTVAKLSERGARAILIGCSEFSLISEQLNSPLPVVDSLDVLVDRIAQFKP
jgi:aspartate racemase